MALLAAPCRQCFVAPEKVQSRVLLVRAQGGNNRFLTCRRLVLTQGTHELVTYLANRRQCVQGNGFGGLPQCLGVARPVQRPCVAGLGDAVDPAQVVKMEKQRSSPSALGPKGLSGVWSGGLPSRLAVQGCVPGVRIFVLAGRAG